MHLVLELRERAGGELLCGEVVRVRGGVGRCGDEMSMRKRERGGELGEGARTAHGEDVGDQVGVPLCGAPDYETAPARVSG